MNKRSDALPQPQPGHPQTGPSGRRATPVRIRRRLASTVLCFCAGIGCPIWSTPSFAQDQPSKNKDKEALKEEGKKLFGREDPKKKSGENDDATNEVGGQNANEGWTITIAVFRENPEDKDVQALASDTLARLQRDGQLPEATLIKRGPALVIAVGNFDSADAKDAQAELKRIQQMQIGGTRPYASAFLAPPMDRPEMIGSLPDYNLLMAHQTHGEQAMYTLQVGVYGRDDLKSPTEEDLAETRKAAEKAALTLRQEGELAFYYHGRTRSMVTIGVFGEDDVDAEGYQSAIVRDAKRRHPYNLYNGKAIRERVPGQAKARFQTSQLVVIPSK